MPGGRDDPLYERARRPNTSSSPSPRLSVLACNDAEVEVVEPEPPAPPRGTPTPPILAVAKASLHDFDVLALVGKVRGVCAAL